ncbi:MAG: exopolysaccharide biosynthesis polyprenyl glycosylphosphotransferase [Rubritepida sp.]|nr:exopolysaccharide biosynthesis polyprenyl glycosylphosphotransferase [Rubritepida sp.]
MSNFSGHSVRTELVALYVAEALICFAAFYAILSAGLPTGAAADQVPLLALAGLLAVCSGLASGAVGLYQPDTWLRAGRVMAGTALVGLLLVIATQLAFPQLDVAAGPGWTGQAALLAAFLAALRNDPVYRVIAEPSLDAFMADPALLRSQRARDVVVADPGALSPALRAQLAAQGVRVWPASEFLERRLGRVDLEALPPGWLSAARAARSGSAEAVLRRTIDLVLAGLLVVFTLPVMLVAALAVKLDSPGPVFYRQQRVGLGGRVFTLYKFRSMTVTAEAGGQAIWAQKNDPRVTRVGSVIRKLRIDEIPQVFNVLRGDMAFIGPRPERPEFVARLAEIIPHYNARAAVRPGITGWAQVNYPYGASDEDARQKLTYDLYYVRRRSLFLDLIILVATIRVVLFQEGAR